MFAFINVVLTYPCKGVLRRRIRASKRFRFSIMLILLFFLMFFTLYRYIRCHCCCCCWCCWCSFCYPLVTSKNSDSDFHQAEDVCEIIQITYYVCSYQLALYIVCAVRQKYEIICIQCVQIINALDCERLI